MNCYACILQPGGGRLEEVPPIVKWPAMMDLAGAAEGGTDIRLAGAELEDSSGGDSSQSSYYRYILCKALRYNHVHQCCIEIYLF